MQNSMPHFVNWLLIANSEQRSMTRPGINLTYAKTMEIARTMEAADANAKSFKEDGPAIRKLTSKPNRSRDARSPCYRCRHTSHFPADCKFKEVTCNHCGKKGHISSVCCSKAEFPQSCSRPQVPTGQDRRGRTKQRSTHCLQEVESITSDKEVRSGD